MGGAAVIGLTALAGCVDNPGPFTITGHPGSFLDLEDGSGNQTIVFDVGSPQCDDGLDNDLDGVADGGDAQCTSGSDANERLAGGQPYTAGAIPVDIDAAGTMTYDSEDLVFQQREYCLPVSETEVWCIGATIRGVGTGQTGSIESGSLQLPAPTRIDLDAVVGFPGLGANCHIGTINAVMSGDSYDLTTGESQLVANDIAVPTASDCGDWTAAIDAFMGLPTVGNATLEVTILNGSGQPVQLS
jgi:hypothetical protein